MEPGLVQGCRRALFNPFETDICGIDGILYLDRRIASL
jgi:hypothetical protein